VRVFDDVAEVILPNEKDLCEAIRSLRDTCTEPHVYLDYRNVAIMHSDDLGELISFTLSLRSDGKQVTIVNADANIRQLLHLTRFDRFVNVPQLADDLAEM